jgi:hypothetical protein
MQPGVVSTNEKDGPVAASPPCRNVAVLLVLGLLPSTVMYRKAAPVTLATETTSGPCAPETLTYGAVEFWPGAVARKLVKTGAAA